MNLKGAIVDSTLSDDVHAIEKYNPIAVDDSFGNRARDLQLNG